MSVVQPVIGAAVILLIGYAFSTNRRAIKQLCPNSVLPYASRKESDSFVMSKAVCAAGVRTISAAFREKSSYVKI